ncbi:MAG TPA: hypothetical protein PKC85_07990 [Bacteroidia bacterium]|jgi:hypothetical protein|nr:hypothetical protein [Bacteroidia bacterium]HMU19777.1 hypothetical protein [Bacteroidia bacterium]
MEKKVWKSLLAIVLIIQTIFVYQNFSIEWFSNYGWLIISSTCIVVMLLFAFPLATLFFKAWSAITNFVGSIISRLILTIIYFLVLWPISILRKIAGSKNTLFGQKHADTKSYFTDRMKTYNTEDFKNPW